MPTLQRDLKAVVARRGVMDLWMAQVKVGQMPDHGLEFSQDFTDKQPDGRVVYLFPAAHLDGVLRDLDIVLSRLG